jgi:ribosomal protein L7/L12
MKPDFTMTRIAINDWERELAKLDAKTMSSAQCEALLKGIYEANMKVAKTFAAETKGINHEDTITMIVGRAIAGGNINACRWIIELVEKMSEPIPVPTPVAKTLGTMQLRQANTIYNASYGGDMLGVIKYIRQTLGIGLKESKDMFEDLFKKNLISRKG